MHKLHSMYFQLPTDICTLHMLLVKVILMICIFPGSEEAVLAECVPLKNTPMKKMQVRVEYACTMYLIAIKIMISRYRY